MNAVSELINNRRKLVPLRAHRLRNRKSNIGWGKGASFLF